MIRNLRKPLSLTAVGVALGIGLIDVASAATVLASSTELISKASPGNGGSSSDAASTESDVSSDGRYVVFTSEAGNLVPGREPAASQIYLKDRQTGIVTLISEKGALHEGFPANGRSHRPSISGNGNVIAFISSASDLVAGDTNGKEDLFIFDRSTTRLSRVNGLFGTQPNGHSDAPDVNHDGSLVAFSSNAGNLSIQDKNSVRDVFRYSRTTEKVDLVSRDVVNGPANGPSDRPQLLANGVVVYESRATDLVNLDSNGSVDVFSTDLRKSTDRNSRLSLTTSGSQANGNSYSPSVSATGNDIVFVSEATNLTPGDTNQIADIFHRSIHGDINLISRGRNNATSDGVSGAPALSADGTFVAFESKARNLTDNPDVNFSSDVFVAPLDCSNDCIRLVSVRSNGIASLNGSVEPSISADGSVVAFSSKDQLSADPDGNAGGFDVYARLEP